MLRSFSFANCQLPTASLSNPFPADIADLRRCFGLFALPTANCFIVKSISRRYRRFTQMLRSFSFANCQLPTASLSNPFPADIADLRRCFGLFPLPTANCQLPHCQIHFPQISQIYADASVFFLCQLPIANCAFLPTVLRSCGLAVLAACGLRYAACGSWTSSLLRSVTPASPPCINPFPADIADLRRCFGLFPLPTASLSNPFPTDIADLRRWFGLFALPTANCQLRISAYVLRSCGPAVLRHAACGLRYAACGSWASSLLRSVTPASPPCINPFPADIADLRRCFGLFPLDNGLTITGFSIFFKINQIISSHFGN